jgi:arylsulfatase A-like enzyme
VHTAIGARLQGKPELVAKYKARLKPEGPKANPTYAAMVESMDQSVGRIVRKLESLKIDRRTLIIFTSDNGGYAASTSNLPLRGAKATAYEGGVRVPLIVSWPGAVKPGSVCDVPVSGVDLYPTILDATGVKPTGGRVIDGESLVPLLRGTGQLRRQAIYWHYPHYSYATTPYGAVRQGDYKLIEFYETGKVGLYNLRKDLGEKKDLHEEMPARATELQQLLRDWRRQVGAQMPVLNPDFKEKTK